MIIYTYKPSTPRSYLMPTILTIIVVAIFSFIGLISFIGIEVLPTSNLFIIIAFAIVVIFVSFDVVYSKPRAFQVEAEGERLFIERNGKRKQIKKVSHVIVPDSYWHNDICHGCRVTTERGTIRLMFAKEAELCAFCMAVQSKRIQRTRNDEDASQEEGMELSCESFAITQNADADDIRTVFTNDVITWECITLLKTECSFIETSYNGDDTFAVRYREGDEDHYFQCTQDLQNETVRQVFLKYLNGDLSWQHDFSWEHIEDRNKFNFDDIS